MVDAKGFWLAIAFAFLAAGQIKAGRGGTKAASPTPTMALAVDHLSGSPDFVVDNAGGNTVAVVRICNPSDKDVPLDLSLSDFQAENGGRLGTDATIQPTQTSIKAKVGDKLTCVIEKITVNKLWFVGSSSAQLLNGKDAIASMTANRARAPFGVKLDGADKPEIHFVRSSKLFSQGSTQIELRNDDTVPYHFRLQLKIDGRKCDTAPALQAMDIGASSGLAAAVVCDLSLFDFLRTGLLKPDSRAGTAIIEFLPYDGRPVLATKHQLFGASLFWFPEYYETIANVFASVVILVLGALTAVVVTLALPNWLRKGNIRNRLLRVRTALNAIHPAPIAEQTRLLLILERSRLEGLRRNCSVWSLDANATLTQVEQSAAALERNTAVVKRLCRVLMSAEDPTSLQYPPSVVRRVRLSCRDAFALLQLMPLSDADVAAVEQSTRDAEKLLASDGQVLDWLETQIRSVEQAIQNLLCEPGPPKAIKRILPPRWDRLQSMNGVALTDVESWDSMPLFPGQYVLRDRRASILSLFLRAITLDAIVPLDTPPERKQIFDEFVRRCAPPADLVALEELVTELEQACYESNVVKGIKDSPVVIVPQGDVLSFSPICLQILLPNEPKLNSAAARSRIGVQWNFDDGTNGGTDWNVWHYFTNRKTPFQITATFSGSDGKPVRDLNDNPVHVTATISAQNIPDKFRHRDKRLEVIRFMLVLLTATFAIQAARQLLPTADVFSAIIGIFALGFGATTVKSLLPSASCPAV